MVYHSSWLLRRWHGCEHWHRHGVDDPLCAGGVGQVHLARDSPVALVHSHDSDVESMILENKFCHEQEKDQLVAKESAIFHDVYTRAQRAPCC